MATVEQPNTEIVKKIEYPSRRVYVIEALEMLADEFIYERRLPPPVEWHPFDHPVHVLFDDTQVASAPEKELGNIFFNMEEIEAIKKVTQLIDQMLNDMGSNHADEAYYQSAYWPKIYNSAKNALEIMNKTPFDETGNAIESEE